MAVTGRGSPIVSFSIAGLLSFQFEGGPYVYLYDFEAKYDVILHFLLVIGFELTLHFWRYWAVADDLQFIFHFPKIFHFQTY